MIMIFFSEVLQKEVIDLLMDIKIASVRQQGLEKILHCRYLSAAFLQAVITAVNKQLIEQGRCMSFQQMLMPVQIRKFFYNTMPK